MIRVENILGPKGFLFHSHNRWTLGKLALSFCLFIFKIMKTIAHACVRLIALGTIIDVISINSIFFSHINSSVDHERNSGKSEGICDLKKCLLLPLPFSLPQENIWFVSLFIKKTFSISSQGQRHMKEPS